jgi:ribosome-associated protein
MIRINDTITLPDDQVEERFVRSIGPRGENPHKYATAVELRLDVERSSLPADVKQRLHALAGRRITTGGVLIVAGRKYSSQLRNREAARQTLVALLRRAATPPHARLPTEPTTAIRENRFATKERKGALKQARRRRREQSDTD